jgi:hypothetical protein
VIQRELCIIYNIVKGFFDAEDKLTRLDILQYQDSSTGTADLRRGNLNGNPARSSVRNFGGRDDGGGGIRDFLNDEIAEAVLYSRERGYVERRSRCHVADALSVCG